MGLKSLIIATLSFALLGSSVHAQWGNYYRSVEPVILPGDTGVSVVPNQTWVMIQTNVGCPPFSSLCLAQIPLPAFAATSAFPNSSVPQSQLNALQSQLSAVQNTIAQTQQSFLQLQQSVVQSFRGTVGVAAMANISMPSAPGRTTWAINGAAFQSEIGGGISFAHRLNLSTPIAITGAYGNGGGTAHIGRVGLMGEF